MPDKVFVLLLASYCSDGGAGCADRHPCDECLEMCNVYEVDREAITSGLYKGELLDDQSTGIGE